MTPARGRLPSAADVVVVGAGAAGSVTARRLAEAGADVVLLEAGATDASRRAGLLDVGPRSQVVSRHPATLDGAALALVRGRTRGGSGAVNGGYCAPMRPVELEAWGPDWPRRYAVGLARAAERLRPRVTPPDAVAARIGAAFPGRSQVIAQARHGDRRVTAFGAWDPPGAGVRVVTGAPVRRLRWAGGHVGGRCDGVVLDAGPDDDDGTTSDSTSSTAPSDPASAEITARTVVLCAGSIGTAELLTASGLGPATGHPVGERTAEHPELLLDLEPGRPQERPGPDALPPLLSRVVRLELPTDDGTAVVEVRPYSVPMHHVIPGPDSQPHRIGVALMNPRGRGRIVPTTGHAGARVDLDAHPDPWDTRALSAAATLVADRLGLEDAPIVSTSHHLAGSARMGGVVDDAGRVLGSSGLRIADASVFPTLPECGPYYSVLAVAEDLAGRMVTERAW